jgi:preprotein translocase subunit YajC
MDPISLFMVAILGMLIYFMIRNSRKQRRTQEELADKLKPGAEVMTSFGLFVKVIDINDDTNVATVDAGNGVILSLHRQTLTKVLDEEEEVPSEDETDDAASEASERPAQDKS